MTSQEDCDDDYLDDPIQLIDYEQRRIIDQTDITNEEYDQADSEGELFIQRSDCNTKKNLFRKQSARTSITLPVKFFDIPQNVDYLNDCRPLFVKIVDCDKHPWYYKKYLGSDKNEEIIDVEDFLPYRKENDCLKKSVNSKDMHNQQSKPKIRPVETPYEMLKIENAEVKSPDSDTPLKEWQKVIKKKALDQRNESQVDFRKNLGLIGLKISHTNETIETPEKQHHSKKGKPKPKAKNEDIKSKNDEQDTKQRQTKTKTAKNSNSLKIINNEILNDDQIAKENQPVEIRNNEVTSNKLAPRLEYIKEPHGLHATPAKKTPDGTSKQSNSVNLTAKHSGFVIPKESGPEVVEKLPENIITPKNHPKTVSTPALTATSSTLSKNEVTDILCKHSKNNDATVIASVSNNLSKLPNLIVTSPKKGPKLTETVQINPVESTPYSSRPKPSECMRDTNTTDKSNLNLVQSHFFSQEQCQKQKNIINEKSKRSNENQQTVSTTDSTSASLNEKNKTLISLLNTKVLNYDNTVITKSFDRNVPKDCKLDKTKKIPLKKETDKSIITGDKKSNLSEKSSKTRKRSNKINPKRFDKFKKTFEKNIINGNIGVVNDNGFKLNLENPSRYGAETCKPQNPAEVKTLRRDSEACQTGVNYSKKKNIDPSSFQIQRDKLPVILNKLQGPWVATPQMSIPLLNNSDTYSNLKQNAHNGPKSSTKSSIKATISASPVGNQASLKNTVEQMPMNDNILLDHRNTSKITTKPALKSSIVMKMGENINIPCYINTPPKTTKNLKIMRRKSVPAHGENKILEVYSNVMRVSNNVSPNISTPQGICGPASTVSRNVPVNQTIQASSPGNLKQYNIDSTSQAQPLKPLITQDTQRKDEENFQPGANKKAPHLQNSRTLFNFNAAAEQIMPQSRQSSQFLLGKLGALQESAVQSAQPKQQPNIVAPNEVGKRPYVADPRQRNIQRQLPPTCDVASPLADTIFHSNESLHPETTFKSRVSFNMPTPGMPQILNQEIVNNSYIPKENWHPQMTHMPQSFNMPSIVQASTQVMVNNSQRNNKPKQVQKTLNPNLSVPPPSLPSKQAPKQKTIFNPQRPNEPMRSQANPKPANFDVPQPNVLATQGNNTQLPNELSHLQTTLPPPNFNVPPPNVPGNQDSNQGMVPQPTPQLQRNIPPGYRSGTYPHFPPNTFPAGPSGDLCMQNPVYPQQFIQRNRRTDYANSRHCVPIYIGVPKNLPVNTMPHHMHNAWNCFYPNMSMPPPRPPCPPRHNLKKISRFVFNDPNKTESQLTHSVAGATVIGFNDTGLVKKININAATVDTNGKQDPVNSAICNENVDTSGLPLGSNNAPVTSKKEMMDELSRATTVISPSKSPVGYTLKYCAEKAKNLNDIHKDNGPSNQVSSPKEPLPSLSPSKANEQVRNRESENRSSPSKIDRNVSNDTSTSSPISHIKDLKRRHPQQNDISETVAAQTLIKRPKPGPLSRKRDLTSIFAQKISDDMPPAPHKGYSPPILPIPTYTKSLQILAKCNQLEMGRRMDYAENHSKESEINNAVDTSQAPGVVLRNKVTEEDKEQQDKATKKISLDEYKKRGLKSDDSKDGTKLLSDDQCKLEVKRESHDQDLGYDSDSTMRI